MDICSPVKINGSAPGTTTFLNTSQRDEPRHPAALKYYSSIESTPSLAFSVVTKNDARVARKITGPSKPGSSKIDSGTHARMGIGRSSSMIGKI